MDTEIPKKNHLFSISRSKVTICLSHNISFEMLFNQKCYGIVRSMFQSSFEDNTITSDFLKSHNDKHPALKLEN